MKKYNFDTIVDRRQSNSIKYDAIYNELPKDIEVLPMWIADMDFATPDFVLDGIRKRLEHPVMGYSIPGEDYYEAVTQWMEKRYHIQVNKEEIAYTPGIVSGIYKVVECLTEKGDGIVLLPPVYPPFSSIIENTERTKLEAPLQLHNGRFEIDFKVLEEQLSKAKALIWCHPHNPGGRVWSADEMIKVANLCHKYNVLIISDEIHADLTYPTHRHIPMATVSPEAALHTITFMAPSKAFNMPGIIGSQIYIQEPKLREKIFTYMEACGLGHGNAEGYTAITAAYTQGEEWLKECTEYIMANVAYVKQFLKEELPELEMIEPEASFLIFINFSKLGLQPNELMEFLVKEAGLLLNEGSTFGTGGEGWMRLNIGLPRQRLEAAMQQLKKAIVKKFR